MPIPRKSLVSVDTTPSYHVVSRCVRRTFLFGIVDSKDFSHRRDAIVTRLAELTQLFCIDISAYAIMSNHYHLVVRIQKQPALDLSITDVALRWRSLYSLPILANRYACDEQLTDAELNEAEKQIEAHRARLYDLTWFMHCLNEPIARMANLEDGCTGRFWEGRFKSQALLDERAELQAMAYVDLNPIRAQLAETLEDSDFTSIQTRLDQNDSTMTPCC
jgi:REP element-mobilizing transposase RayT